MECFVEIQSFVCPFVPFTIVKLYIQVQCAAMKLLELKLVETKYTFTFYVHSGKSSLDRTQYLFHANSSEGLLPLPFTLLFCMHLIVYRKE